MAEEGRSLKDAPDSSLNVLRIIMTSFPFDLAELVEQCQSGIVEILGRSTASAERAGALADLLRQLCPQAARTACWLNSDGTPHLALRPQSAAGEEEKLLQALLSTFDPLAKRVYELPAQTCPGLQVLAASIHEIEWPRGFLVLGLPDSTAEATVHARTLLTVAAGTMARCLELEGLRRERAELASFALLGQAFAGLAHDLNNALNSIMLQASVVQLRVEEQTRQELAVIRQHGVQAAALVRSLQQIVQERREQSYPVDLNDVLRQLLAEEPELCRHVSSHLTDETLRLQGTRSAVKQLLSLLLEGACTGTNAAVSVATAKGKEGAALSLTLTGVTDAGAEDGQVFADKLLWQNLDEVGRKAGQSLLRQLGGALTTERTGEGIRVLRVVWAS
jgi:hypothetical protein